MSADLASIVETVVDDMDQDDPAADLIKPRQNVTTYVDAIPVRLIRAGGFEKYTKGSTPA